MRRIEMRFSSVLSALIIGLMTVVGVANAVETADIDELGIQPALLVQLAVADLDRSIAFYQDVLGFELESRNDAIQWARMKLGIEGVTIGLGVQGEPEGSGTVSLNFGVGNLARTRAVLESRGVSFDGPTINIPGVISLADFRDPDGNKLRLAGPHEKPQEAATEAKEQ